MRAFLLDQWLPAKVATLKPSTAATYEQMIRSYVVPRIGDVALGKVDGAMLNSLYADLLAEGRTGASGRSGGLSAKCVRNVHGVLHRAFRDAVRWRTARGEPLRRSRPTAQGHAGDAGVVVGAARSVHRGDGWRS